MFHDLVESKIVVEKTFVDCSPVLPPKDATLPNFTKKSFANSHKPQNSQNFPVIRYIINYIHCNCINLQAASSYHV